MQVHVVKPETLRAAYQDAKRQRGAPGCDGVTFQQIEAAGLDEFLKKLAEDLRAGTYTPQPYRRVEIPKAKSKVRVISIPTIRDRVVQGALRLILEPIFEADFSDNSYGARPGRSALEALGIGRLALHHRKLYIADVDLAAYFDNIRHDRLLEKVARRIQDRAVLAMIKQFLKSGGRRGLPQGSPLSLLLANLALNDLDHALARGGGLITYVRYLDDMIVLGPNTEKGQRWANRALERIREEAIAIGVLVNEEKTRVVDVTTARASFTFLGFVFRWKQSPRTNRWYPNMVPRPEKVTEVLRAVRRVLRVSRHLKMPVAVGRINEIVRGWANYFRIGNSSDALSKVRREVELKVRRFASRKSKRRGFGWKRWSSDVVYEGWGLYSDYQVRYWRPSESRIEPEGTITSMS